MVKALELRVTHKYVGTYQHEDEWKTLGEYEVLSSQKWRPVEEDKEGEYDITDPIKHYYEVAVIPYGATYDAEEVRQALKDSFTQVGCHHEYDCCGCRSFYASNPEFLYQAEDGIHYRITVNSYRNY